jgi:hypothetical protein
MAKEKTTLYLERTCCVTPRRQQPVPGRDESAAVDDPLDPDEALALAYAELRADRAERNASAA